MCSLENVLTRKGIWAAGCLGLAAVAAFCFMHHARDATKSTPTKIDPANTAVSVAAQTPAAAIIAPAPVVAKVEPIVPAPTPLLAPSAASVADVNPAQTPSAQSPKVLQAKKVFKTPKRTKKQVIAQRKLQQAKAKAKARQQFALKRYKNREPIIACEARQSANAIKSICFAFNSDKLNASSRARLDKIVPVLNQNNSTRYELAGFTDRYGSADYNDSLAKRDRKSVV